MHPDVYTQDPQPFLCPVFGKKEEYGCKTLCVLKRTAGILLSTVLKIQIQLISEFNYYLFIRGFLSGRTDSQELPRLSGMHEAGQYTASKNNIPACCGML